MIFESLRTALYPLGFLANTLFTGRFMLQWFQSERKKESTVSKSFWQISFFAHFTMCLHGYIQLQYPICLIQGLNAVIAWRNLNLMGQRKFHFKTVVWMMALTLPLLSCLFFFQRDSQWMRPPTLPWSESQAAEAGLIWHLLGFFAMVLFASRYWVQWWLAEKHQKSYVGKSFWWLSSIGAFFSMLYALRLADPVNFLAFSVGLIPYVRNLMLLNKRQSNSLPSSSKSLFLFAGEQSGDVLGGNLVRALKTKIPHVDLYGVGGPEMEKAGMRITHPMNRFQVMGFTDVLKALPRLYGDFKKIHKHILKHQPAGVVLIDYPDFTMRLAQTLRKKGYKGKVIHYVCPSVWAWRKKRVCTLANTLDHLLAILPFEGNCFSNTSLPVTFVGHPLVAAIDRHIYDPTWKTSKPLIAIFPGSRQHEIHLNLPIQLAAAKRFADSHMLAISVARPDLQECIQKYAEPAMLLVPSENRYELMQAAEGAIATSGTIILELGLHSVPTVVTYQLATLNYLLGRYAFRIRLPFYTLVNIICEKEVYPEFIHRELSEKEIYLALMKLIKNPEPCRQECSRLRQLLTVSDASLKAASIIEQEITIMMKGNHNEMPMP